MWIAIAVFTVALGLGAYGVSTQHGGLERQNQALKTEVKTLKAHQIPNVTKLDGIEITNLESLGK